MPAKASRAAFGEALLELAATDPRIVTVDADLSKSTMTAAFAKAYPDRAFNVGIAESNLLGIGAGLALTGRSRSSARLRASSPAASRRFASRSPTPARA